jgi:hypothetical protein
MSQRESLLAETKYEAPAAAEQRSGICDGYNYKYIGEIEGQDFGWRCDLYLNDGTPQYIYLDLPEYFEPYGHIYTAREIGEKVGCPHKGAPTTVSNTVRRLSIEPEICAAESGKHLAIYSNLSYEIIKQELEWKKLFDAQKPRLSPHTICRLIGRNNRGGFADSVAKTLGVPASAENGTYSRSFLNKIRNYDRQFQKHEGRLASYELSIMAGYEKPTWAEGHLRAIGVEPELCWGRKGRLSNLYPLDAINLLRASEKVRVRGAEMMTGRMISVMVREQAGLNRDWTLARLKQFDHLSELREDDCGRVRRHYPQAVLELILEQAEILLQETTGNADSWSVEQVCEYFGYDAGRLTRVRRFMAKNATSTGLSRHPRANDGRVIIGKGWDPKDAQQIEPLFVRQVQAEIGRKQKRGVYDEVDYQYLRQRGVPLDLVKADGIKPFVELVGYESK